MPVTAEKTNAEPAMESPCVKICVIDKVRRICTGCGRTLDEIAVWSAISSSDRRQIMSELPARLEQLT
jgi:uncharacterized protein